VIQDRNPLSVTLANGAIRNGYTVKILNKLYQERTYRLAIEGLPGARLSVLGLESAVSPEITVVPDTLREVKAFVAVPVESLREIKDEVTPFAFLVTDTTEGRETRRAASFRRPPR
jgi:polyferredoxin